MRDQAFADIDITGLTADSREVRPGYLFAAMPGFNQDGAAFIDDALANGAAALLVHSSVPTDRFEIPVLVDPMPRHRFANLAAKFYGAQPDTIVAVTGTSGKSSIVGFARQIWQAMGIKAGSLGTLGAQAQDYYVKVPHTTPEPATLHRLLRELRGLGVNHLALEASSHGIDQCRLDGVQIAAAVFTNLSRDHLDYHPDARSYFAAKRRLFSELLPEGGLAVINAGSDYADDLVGLCRQRGIRVLRYGDMSADVGCRQLQRQAGGQLIALKAGGEEAEVFLPLVGDFQAENVMAALAIAIGLGADPKTAIGALARLKGTPGRLELVAERRSGGRIYVDYAHKPEAIGVALQALRPFTEGRLIIVFGCGGDRDPGKRPMMAAAAKANADLVIVTDDNPRTEDPAEIRRQALTGAPDGREIGDRADAIRTACGMLESGDVLLIAGKGHETGQEIHGVQHPFDDAVEARAAIEALDGGVA